MVAETLAPGGSELPTANVGEERRVAGVDANTGDEIRFDRRGLGRGGASRYAVGVRILHGMQVTRSATNTPQK